MATMINIIQKLQNKIASKYYIYQKGEFFPIYDGNELLNKKEFHKYKAKRAVFLIRNYKLVINAYTHQRG